MDVGSKIKKMYNKAVSWGSKKGLLLVIISIISFGALTITHAQTASKVDRGKGVIMSTITSIAHYILSGLSKFATKLIEFVLLIGNYNDFINIAPVVNAWVVIRDLTNIAIILAVIIVAFGTIFGVSRFGDIKSLPKILIAGVLINFSRTIVGFLIDGSQLIMSAFMQGLSAVAAPGLVSTLGLLKYSQLNDKLDPSAINHVSKIFMEIFVSTGFVIMVNAVLVVIVMTLLFRIVTFWLVVAVSPAAFLAAVLPGTKGMFNEWRKYLVNNLLNGPFLAFFLWLAISIMASMNSIVTSFGPIAGDGDAVTEFFKGSNILTTLIGVVLLILAVGFASSLAAIGAKSVENLGWNYLKTPIKPFSTPKRAGQSLWTATKMTGKLTGKALGKTAQYSDALFFGGQARETRQRWGRTLEGALIDKPKTWAANQSASWSRHQGLVGLLRGWGKDTDKLQKQIDGLEEGVDIAETKQSYAAARMARKLWGQKSQEAKTAKDDEWMEPGISSSFDFSDSDLQELSSVLRLSGQPGKKILKELSEEVKTLREQEGYSKKDSDAKVLSALFSTDEKYLERREYFQRKIEALNKQATTKLEATDGAEFTDSEKNIWQTGDTEALFGMYNKESSQKLRQSKQQIQGLKDKLETITEKQAQGSVSYRYAKTMKSEMERQAKRLKPAKEEIANEMYDSVDEMATAYLGFFKAKKFSHMKALLEAANNKGLMAKFADTLGNMNPTLFAGDTNEKRVLSVVARAFLGNGYFNDQGLNEEKLEGSKPAAFVQLANTLEQVSKKGEATGDLHLTGLINAKYGEYRLTDQATQNKKVLELLRAGKGKTEDLHRIILNKDGELNDVGRQYLEQAGTTLAAKIRSGRIENQEVIDAISEYLFDDNLMQSVEEGFEPLSEEDLLRVNSGETQVDDIERKPMNAKVRNSLMQMHDVMKAKFTGDGSEAVIKQIENEKDELDKKVARYVRQVEDMKSHIKKMQNEIKSGVTGEKLEKLKGDIAARQATVESLRNTGRRYEAQSERKSAILNKHKVEAQRRENGTTQAANETSAKEQAEFITVTAQSLRGNIDNLLQQLTNLRNGSATDKVAQANALEGQMIEIMKNAEQLPEGRGKETVRRFARQFEVNLKRFMDEQGGNS